MFDNKHSSQPSEKMKSNASKLTFKDKKDSIQNEDDPLDPELVASPTITTIKQLENDKSIIEKSSSKDKSIRRSSLNNTDKSSSNNRMEGESNDSSKTFAEGESDASCKDNQSRPCTNRNLFIFNTCFSKHSF
jgi:hypothetical protein